MKIACIFIHYFSPHSKFSGQSKNQIPEVRHLIVSRALSALKALPNTEVLVFGASDLESLVSIDVKSQELSDRRLLGYEAFNYAENIANEYDYILIVEDDILVSYDFLNFAILFDQKFEENFSLIPNRVEINKNKIYCIDTMVYGKFMGPTYSFGEHKLRQHTNPHSAISFLNRDKFKYCRNQIDKKFNGLILGGYVASAFAHNHSPVSLLRITNDLSTGTVLHLDKWQARSTISKIRFALNLKGIKINSFRNKYRKSST